MTEPDRLICLPVDFQAFVVSGSIKDSCDQCYASVWISPSSQRMLAKQEVRPEIICTRCYEAGDRHDIVLVPGQLQEIASMLGPETAALIAKSFQPRPETN